MSVKVLAAKVFAQVVDKKVQKWAQNPIKTQEKVFKKLLYGLINHYIMLKLLGLQVAQNIFQLQRNLCPRTLQQQEMRY